ncbi:MAG: hypothetical protein J6U61_09565, partial [Lachnospiraceae bacterium]|nr:hypothetical protein [Lachnospiraceae bacterium]
MKKFSWKKLMSLVLVFALIIGGINLGTRIVSAEEGEPYYQDQDEDTTETVVLDGTLTTNDASGASVDLEYTLV